MSAWYNENDKYAAQWLRNLIAAGHIAPGVVDSRSIKDVQADELREFTQCHFFAGIGVWSHALRRAGWTDDRPVWTGSCPCQPFSGAGKRRGHEDERHLWPTWQGLISQRRPVSVFGEQVASPDGIAWLDPVLSDLEDSDYTVGACVTPAAGFGAPHGRHRIFFVADTGSSGCDPGHTGEHGDQAQAWPGRHDVAGCGGAGGMGNTGGSRGGRDTRADAGSQGQGQVQWPQPGRVGDEPEPSGPTHRMDHATEPRLALWRHDQDPRATLGLEGSTAGGPGPVNGHWADAEWVLCRDPKGPRWRPIEPGSFPVVDGATQRVGRLRAYGNAINAEQARAFISAYMECRP